MASLEHIADGLEREVATLAANAAGRIYEELPDYAIVPREELLESIHLNVHRGVNSLRAKSTPTDETGRHEPQQTTRRRMDQGVPIDAIIRSYRINLTAIHDRFIEMAREQALPAEETLLGSTLLWKVGDWFMDRAVREYRVLGVSDEVRRSMEKAAVLKAFSENSEDIAATLKRAKALGLKSGVDYRVVLTGATPHDEWVRMVERFGATSESPAIASSLGDFAAGIVARDPHEAVCHGPVSAGSWTNIENIPSSWKVADRVKTLVDTSSTRHNWNDRMTLTWRLSVTGDDLVHGALADRYLRPLVSEKRFGEVLLNSIWVYLECSQKIRESSRRLMVHENTLRYRIQRFEALTDVSLENLDTVVELAWLRESLRLRGDLQT